MSDAPFPDQMLAAPAFVAYVIAKVWCPLAADVAVLLVTGLLLAVGGWLIDRGSARITAHRTARALDDRRAVDDAFNEIMRYFNDTAADEPTQMLPDVVHLGSATPPHHELPHRRPFGMRALHRRIVRRQTTSSSDRRSR